MKLHLQRNAFNAGEFSPLLDGRTDIPKYNYGCRVMQNWFPRIYGIAQRRPGLLYSNTLAGSARLFEFNISAAEQFILALTSGEMRAYEDGVLDTATAIDTPYATADLFEVQMKQINNAAYFTHPDYPPQKLTRTINPSTGDNVWTWVSLADDANITSAGITVEDWIYPAMRGENISTTTVYSSATSGSGVTLTFSADVFVDTDDLDNYIGSHVEITHNRANASADCDLSGTNNSDSLFIVGDYTVTTYGTWTGTLAIEAKDVNGTWRELRVFEGTAAEPRNISYKATALRRAEFRLAFTYTSHSGNPKAVLEVEDTRSSALCEITAVASKTSCTVTVLQNDIYASGSGNATPYFRLGAWGLATGYPRAVSFHEQRLIFGGTTAQPATIWMSETNNFENFRYGAYDADAIAFTLAADEASAIQSIISHVALLIFTQTEEWALLTSEQTPITPANLYVRRQSRIGTAHKQPLMALDSILMLERGGRKIRQFQYGGTEGGVSEDLTVLAEHLMRSGVKQMKFQQSPDPIVWCITNDGELISMTVDQTQGVIGWCKHTTDGTFESVAVTYGDNGIADDVYFSVKRTINSSDVYYLEKLDSDWLTKLEDEDSENYVYVDCAKIITQSSSDVVTVGSYLVGEEVAGLADGVYFSGLTVDGSNQITLPSEATTIVVGLPFTSLLQPSKFEVALQDGTARDRNFRTEKVWVNVWKARGLEFADYNAATASTDWHTDTGNAIASAYTDIFTGLMEEQIDGESRENVDVTIRAKTAYPAAIRSVIFETEVSG